MVLDHLDGKSLRTVEDKLSEEILKGNINKGDNVSATYGKIGELIFKTLHI